MTSQSTYDPKFMEAALRLARRGFGKTWPNPMVGAVLVHKNKIIAQGYHAKYGQQHAEANLFYNLSHSTKKSTLKTQSKRTIKPAFPLKIPADAVLYLTLEPCTNFHGKKTPSCTELILKNNVRNIVIAMQDPNPNVNGTGITTLQKAGIQVHIGLLQEKAQKLNEVYTKYIATNLPFITVKIAASLDGKIATSTGPSKWITSAKAREYVHKLRSLHNGILTSSTTVIADDPHLGLRLGKKSKNYKDPYRIIIDRDLKTNPDSQVYRDSNVIVLTSHPINQHRYKSFHERNIEVITLEENAVLQDYLAQLPAKGIYNIMVEAGGTLITSLLQNKLVDKIIYFIAPKIIGSEGMGAIGELGIKNIEDALSFKQQEVKKIGEDIVISGYIEKQQTV